MLPDIMGDCIILRFEGHSHSNADMSRSTQKH